MPQVPIVRTVKDLRARIAKWRKAGETVALVPTMGALHAGHLSLIALAKSSATRVVASIFVNPTQFAPNEDFKSYPRDEAGDLDKLVSAGAHLVFAPDVNEMYPPGSSTLVRVGDVTEGLCDASRPHHFEGVATVVTKLLLQCAPDVAVFGEKDYRQLQMIRRLVLDLPLQVKIVPAPIMREADGLAMSSRNAYLSPAEREIAPLLYRIISAIASDLAEGHGAGDAAEAGRFRLEAAGFRVDYVAVRDPETLAPVTGPLKQPARVLAAVYLGKTRLIDNVAAPHKGKPAKQGSK
jgi:pantoate--beta-alanine ligase